MIAGERLLYLSKKLLLDIWSVQLIISQTMMYSMNETYQDHILKIGVQKN